MREAWRGEPYAEKEIGMLSIPLWKTSAIVGDILRNNRVALYVESLTSGNVKSPPLSPYSSWLGGSGQHSDKSPPLSPYSSWLGSSGQHSDKSPPLSPYSSWLGGSGQHSDKSPPLSPYSSWLGGSGQHSDKSPPLSPYSSWLGGSGKHSDKCHYYLPIHPGWVVVGN